MRRFWLVCAILATACRQQATDSLPPVAPEPMAGAGPQSSVRPATWNLQSSGEGTALVLIGRSGATVLRLFCSAGRNQLLVNVPSFEPIGSEERLSFGGGGDVIALVADTRGDRQRGGVSGTGAAPVNLARLLLEPVSASYGAQTSGPHPAPGADHARALAEACLQKESSSQRRDHADAQPSLRPAHPCSSQDGKSLPAMRLKAIGTEPFWGARIEGRCVTYSHPDDQKGTRVWTRFSGSAERGAWAGSLGGQPFVLRTSPQPGCSDGMSDRRYPIAVNLTVNGEQRKGCAERP